MTRRESMEPADAPIGITPPSLFGCLRRLVMFAVFLAILAMMAFFFLFGVGGLLN